MNLRFILPWATTIILVGALSLKVLASDLPISGQPKGEPKIKVGDKAPLPIPGLKKAHQAGKAIILMLGYPPHCNWCDRMDRIIYETLPFYQDEVAFIQKQVERARFVPPDQDGIKLKKAFGTEGQPWLFFIDKEGIVRNIYPYWISQKQLIEVLNTIVMAKKNSPNGPMAPKAENNEFTLTITETSIELKGIKFPGWAFNGTIPGPEIRVREGDKVKIRLVNKSRANHSIMFHGLHIPFKVLQQEEEPVPPGYEYTYEFIAKPSGTHLYHCNFNMAEHLDRGLYGAFIVEEKERKEADREFTYILDEWNSKQAQGQSHHSPGHPRAIKDYDVVTINGKAVGEKNPMIMEVKKGERIRIRLLNVGYLPHTLRFPGGFIITHEDGYPFLVTKKETSVTIMPGKRYDLFLEATQEGRRPFYHSIKLPASKIDVASAHPLEIGIFKKEEATLIMVVKGNSSL